MEQRPINQRLIFLLKSLKMSARTFSDAIGESPTNTQNYVGTRNAEPRASYLENVLRHFATINPLWLLTGEGAPFTSEAAEPHPSYTIQKKNTGNVVGTNHGTVSQQHSNADCEKELAAARQTISLLSSQLLDKDKIIKLYERQLQFPPPK